jgi:4-hydroxyphenylpyruvate dioxygenase
MEPTSTTPAENPVGLRGIEFVELASPDPDALHRMLLAFGFSRTMRHEARAIDLYEQNDIRFLVNRQPASFAASFVKSHGPSVPSMAWRVVDGEKALAAAAARGGKPSTEGDYRLRGATEAPLPAVEGIGGSLIYLTHRTGRALYESLGFVPLEQPDLVPDHGFLVIDHLTNNVFKGTMAAWAAFYKDVFGFTEVRYFDIRGVRTGLTSYALRSPDGSFCIPINEADEKKSQINEYLDEYKGPGVQHIAFLTRDILQSLAALDGKPIQFLDMDDEYYAEVFQRVPHVTEDRAEIRKRQVLVDGDEEGYLLQIFTKNLVGPIFIELLQRKNHHSFGEGNFSALFRSIERDQARRGVFDGEAGRPA